MKKLLTYSCIFIITWITMVGVTCETRNIEVPVVNSATTPIHIQSTSPAFLKTGMYDASGDIEKIRNDEGFIQIVTVNLQAVEYKITTNSSTAGTKLNGQIQVSESVDGPYKNLLELVNFDPQAEINITHIAELNADGVTEINNSMSIYSGDELTFGSNQLYYRLQGTATSPGVVNTDFVLELKILLSILGVVEVEVPVGP